MLHTRVPAVLEQELKRLAGSLKVPVSNVVRTILEDAVEAVDSVGRAAEDELRDVADRLRNRRGVLRTEPRGRRRGAGYREVVDADVVDATVENTVENSKSSVETAEGAEVPGDQREEHTAEPRNAQPSEQNEQAQRNNASRNKAPLAGILGYQPLLLAREESCTLCGRVLSAGDEGFLGIRDGAGPRVLLGKECLPFSAANRDQDDSNNQGE